MCQQGRWAPKRGWIGGSHVDWRRKRTRNNVTDIRDGVSFKAFSPIPTKYTSFMIPSLFSLVIVRSTKARPQEGKDEDSNNDERRTTNDEQR